MDLGDRRVRRGLIWLIGGLTLGCGPEDRVRADLQLDVVGAELIDTDWVRICVEKTLIHETPVGDGRLAIPGVRWASGGGKGAAAPARAWRHETYVI